MDCDVIGWRSLYLKSSYMVPHLLEINISSQDTEQGSRGYYPIKAAVAP